MESITEKMKKHADILARVLHRRLGKHIRNKIADQSKHNHPALLFVATNLNRFAALICYYGQARTKPVMHPDACLLVNPTRGGFVEAKDTELEGSYLRYSTKEFIWIRSGRVVGSDVLMNRIVKRNESGHKKKAATASLLDGVGFYTLYPSQLSKNQLLSRIGYFEDLKLYSGFCFKRNGNVSGLVSTNDGAGLLDWSI